MHLLHRITNEVLQPTFIPIRRTPKLAPLARPSPRRPATGATAMPFVSLRITRDSAPATTFTPYCPAWQGDSNTFTAFTITKA